MFIEGLDHRLTNMRINKHTFMIDDVVKRLDDSYTVRLTKEMIAIPSVTGDEEALSEYIKDKLESYGMKTEIQYVEPGRPNVYGVMKGDSPGKRLNYNAHTDTVPAGDGWETNPFEAVIRDGKIYGRGACDMKSYECLFCFGKNPNDETHCATSGTLLGHAFLVTDLCEAIVTMYP